MRGQQVLFADLLAPKVIEAPKPSGIGRSKTLIEKRDKRMLYRYYFYARLLKKQYPIVISILSEQFDLSELRVITCISEKHTDLKAIFDENLTPKDLSRLYPWLNWEER